MGNITSIFRRSLPFSVYKPPVSVDSGLPPLSILRLMFPDMKDGDLTALTSAEVEAKKKSQIEENSALLGDVLVTTTTTTTTEKPANNETESVSSNNNSTTANAPDEDENQNTKLNGTTSESEPPKSPSNT